ncbi:MAG: DinB family protein [SAR202 cluster bacterium]|jgi:hypothetical protein|nr:DinB family protein [SAR202 cluster bacterium]|tara:strand:+ start:199 stop:618 length:420 start_codon:yes stop_codon:yes gene_type:complete
MSEISVLLEKMSEQRRKTQDRVREVTEEQMLAKAHYGDREVNARFFFYRLVTHQVEHTVHLTKTLQALNIAQSEAELILKNLQAASGELEGILVGLSDEDLDKIPREGDWSVRKVLEHILEGEESYGRQIEEATNGITS